MCWCASLNCYHRIPSLNQHNTVGCIGCILQHSKIHMTNRKAWPLPIDQGFRPCILIPVASIDCNAYTVFTGHMVYILYLLVTWSTPQSRFTVLNILNSFLVFKLFFLVCSLISVTVHSCPFIKLIHSFTTCIQSTWQLRLTRNQLEAYN